MEKVVKKKDKQGLKGKWGKYLKNSKLTPYEAKRRAEWYAGNGFKVPKD